MAAYQSATNELLRHFWASAEPNYRPDKNTRMVEALKKQQEKVKEVLIVANAEGIDIERIKQVGEVSGRSMDLMDKLRLTKFRLIWVFLS